MPRMMPVTLVVPLAVALSPLACGCAPAATAPAPAAAAEAPSAPKELGASAGWTAYTLSDSKSQICYIVGQPEGSDPKAKRKPHLLVTHRPAEKAFSVVSIDLGADLPANGSADVTVGKQKFAFFTKQTTAWSRDSDTDKAVVTAMLKAKELTIAVKPAKGADLKDSYALDGVAAAVALIDKACKVKR